MIAKLIVTGRDVGQETEARQEEVCVGGEDEEKVWQTKINPFCHRSIT